MYNKKNLLLQIRKNQNFTQSEIADLLGISRSTVAKIEKGDLDISKKVHEKLNSTFPKDTRVFTDSYMVKIKEERMQRMSSKGDYYNFDYFKEDYLRECYNKAEQLESIVSSILLVLSMSTSSVKEPIQISKEELNILKVIKIKNTVKIASIAISTFESRRKDGYIKFIEDIGAKIKIATSLLNDLIHRTHQYLFNLKEEELMPVSFEDFHTSKV